MSAALAGLGMAQTAGAAVAAPRDPSGTWLIEDRGARVRVEKCQSSADRICGYVVWVKPGGKAPATDVKNSDPKKAGRKILGHQIMLGLKANEDDQWEGLIYNAQDGKTYDVTVWTERAGELKVKGCLVAFLCSTQTWTLASDAAPNQLTGVTGSENGPSPDPEWASKTPRPGPGGRRDSKSGT